MYTPIRATRSLDSNSKDRYIVPNFSPRAEIATGASKSIVPEEIIRLVNHEVWIECEIDRAYLKWGHLPETDGKLDPKSIKRAFVVDPDGNEKAIVVGSDKEASSKGALFLEFNAEKDGLYLIAVEYDRGIYSVTEGNKWIFGEKKPMEELPLQAGNK